MGRGSVLTQSTSSRPIRVMIADDNREFCRVLRKFIEQQDGMMVVGVAHDGRQVLSMLEKQPADVLLLDIIMPYLDGLGVLERFDRIEREDRPVIIALTAFGQENVNQRVASLGASYVVLKPFDLPVLAQRIKQVVKEFAGSTAAMASEGRSVEVEVTELLREIGVPAHIKGYEYLRTAILSVIRRPEYMGAITKELYPSVAEKYDTTGSRVERAMRHAIEVAWNRNDIQVTERIFGQTIHAQRGKPTNSEFIAMVADLLRMSSRETF